MSHLHSLFLDGEWPVLGPAPPLSARILRLITDNASGSAISTHGGHLSLGLFYINTDLVEPYPTQRSINKSHFENLSHQFEERGILHKDNPGVVIGLGKGWYNMKNSNPSKYKIGDFCPHLGQLSLTNGGPIAQVIHVGHQTQAMREYKGEDLGSKYWLYNVLIPGMFPFIFNPSFLSCVTVIYYKKPTIFLLPSF